MPNTRRAGLRSAEDEALDTLPDTRINAAMQALPEQFRMAVYYADVEDLKYTQIAEIMDVPKGTVMSRLHRGRRQLRRLLTDAAAETSTKTTGPPRTISCHPVKPGTARPNRQAQNDGDVALDRLLIGDALAQLSAERLAVVRRAYYLGWTTAQIADDLQIAETRLAAAAPRRRGDVGCRFSRSTSYRANLSCEFAQCLTAIRERLSHGPLQFLRRRSISWGPPPRRLE